MGLSYTENIRPINWRGNCPHCGEEIRFRLQTDFGSFTKDGPDLDWMASISGVARELLDIAQTTGVLASYQQALKARKAPPPGNPSKAFLHFLDRMRPLPVPPKIEIALQSEFPRSKTAIYSCGDISALAVDGALRLFIPTSHLFKKQAPGAAPTNGTVKVGAVKVKELTQEMQDFRAWVKTRMGYVPVEGGIFLQEMRKRCYGAFGTHEKTQRAGGAA